MTTPEAPWWADHQKLAITAEFMVRQDATMSDVLYMLSKPWKHNDDYALAEAELALPEELT